PYYALAKESGKVSFPPIYMDADTKALVTTISAPVLDQGKVIGVAGVDMSLASMQEEMGGIRIMGDGFVTVVSEDGMILATHDPSMVGKDISLLFPDKVKAAIKSREGYSHVDRLQNHGRRFLHQIRSLSYGDGSTSWGFIVSLPLDEIMAESLKDGMIELFISVVGIILVLVMIIWLIGRMTRDIAAGVNYAEAIASGRLDAEFSLRRGDEIGLLADSLRKMTAWMKSSLDESSRLAEENARSREKTEEALAAIKTKVNKEQERQAKMRELAERIDMIAGDLRSEINILVERIQKAEDDAGFTMAQAQKNKEAVHILEEITAQVLRQVEIAVSSTEGAKEQAVQGDEVMKAVSGSVERIARSSENLKLILSSLAGRAQGVGDILTVISDIADQTNLLALNAAIEAARAGEAGRGFAVVADEVRKLAEKTMQSTKQVGDVTGSIKEETLKSVGAMEESLQEVQASSEHSASSSAALKDIVALVEKSAAEVSLISSISAKQAEANESIVHASDQVEEIAQNTVQTMRAASEGVGHMADLAHKLAETTSALRALE
ncbi:MAG: methyl-accepting chemotaxis protein, partial [Deltaproteobacteria bacterium]|nr:methyl-accepting chemotaxis protein [Deltaproteobacteria bacterium]